MGVFSRASSPFNRVRREKRNDGIECLTCEYFSGPNWIRKVRPVDGAGRWTTIVSSTSR